jgi:hypothetical protein
MLRSPPALALTLALALLSSACQDPTTDDDDDSTDDTSGELSHADDIQPIWDANCVTFCHEPGGLASSLDLTDAYDQIVNVASTQTDADLIEPGSADGSYLLAKLRGTQLDVGGQGNRMPAGGAPPLDDATIQQISAWIEAGAPP